MNGRTLIQEKMFFYLRMFASLLLLSCIAPTSEAPAGKTLTLASLLASMAGDVKLVIWKSHYTVTLYKGGVPVKTYRAVFGQGHGDGDKQMQGDKRTPEGEFYICTMSNSKRFYKFMGLSYPNLRHAEYGLQTNVISPGEYMKIKKAIEDRQTPPWETRLGGAVGIHGRTLDGGTSTQRSVRVNWTDGCVALNNSDVDEIFSAVSLGTPVTILP